MSVHEDRVAKAGLLTSRSVRVVSGVRRQQLEDDLLSFFLTLDWPTRMHVREGAACEQERGSTTPGSEMRRRRGDGDEGCQRSFPGH